MVQFPEAVAFHWSKHSGLQRDQDEEAESWEAGETAHSIKQLPHKHEGLVAIPPDENR